MLLDIVGQHFLDAVASASSSDPYAALHHHHQHAHQPTTFFSIENHGAHHAHHVTAFPSAAQAICGSTSAGNPPPLDPATCAFFKTNSPTNAGLHGQAPVNPQLAFGHNLTWMKCNPVAVGHEIGNEKGRSIIQCPNMAQDNNKIASARAPVTEHDTWFKDAFKHSETTSQDASGQTASSTKQTNFLWACNLGSRTFFLNMPDDKMYSLFDQCCTHKGNVLNDPMPSIDGQSPDKWPAGISAEEWMGHREGMLKCQTKPVMECTWSVSKQAPELFIACPGYKNPYPPTGEINHPAELALYQQAEAQCKILSKDQQTCEDPSHPRPCRWNPEGIAPDDLDPPRQVDKNGNIPPGSCEAVNCSTITGASMSPEHPEQGTVAAQQECMKTYGCTWNLQDSSCHEVPVPPDLPKATMEVVQG